MGQIDPVCGMKVEAESAAGSYALDGRTYLFCSERCLNTFKQNPQRYVDRSRSPETSGAKRPDSAPMAHDNVARTSGRMAEPVAGPRSVKDVAKDPICGMLVDKATALRTERAGRIYYFCSVNCRRTFESPEAELKSMRTRVAIALTGVLALAILRASAFIALAAGATILTWAPIPQLPWFTWEFGCFCW
jgi:P-type Cu+ transporter